MSQLKRDKSNAFQTSIPETLVRPLLGKALNTKMKRLEELTIKEMADVLAVYQIIPYYGREKGEDFGYCDHEKKIIFINTSKSESAVIRTIYHEMAHAYNHMTGRRDSERNAKEVEKNTWRRYRELQEGNE